MLRAIAFLLIGLVLTACSTSDEVMDPPVDLGNFALGHNVVVAPRAATVAAISREVPEEELTSTIKAEIAERLDRYEGTKQYHLGVSVEGYVLARRGVPVVAAPKSVMIVQITVWDDAKGEKLNVPPDQITVIEDIDAESFLGSGWLQSSDAQLDELASKAAKAIEQFLLTKNKERGWFESDEEAARRIAVSEAAAAAELAEEQNDAPAVRVDQPETEPEAPDNAADQENAASGA